MQKTFCENCFRVKRRFTLVRVMFANKLLPIIVAGFAKIIERVFKQIQLNNRKTELALRLDKWTIEKLNGTLKAGYYKGHLFWL